MITNIDKLFDQITSWICDRLRSSCRKSFIVAGNTDEPSVGLVYKLCCNSGMATYNLPNIDYSEIDWAHWAANHAEKYNGLIVGDLMREEIFAKSYHKYGRRLADIFPIGDMYYDDVCMLFGLKPPEVKQYKIRDIPSDLVKWADKEDKISGIISNTTNPNTSRVWFKYTLPQKEVISKLHQYSKLTTHKQISAPIFGASNSEFIQ